MSDNTLNITIAVIYGVAASVMTGGYLWWLHKN